MYWYIYYTFILSDQSGYRDCISYSTFQMDLIYLAKLRHFKYQANRTRWLYWKLVLKDWRTESIIGGQRWCNHFSVCIILSSFFLTKDKEAIWLNQFYDTRIWLLFMNHFISREVLERFNFRWSGISCLHKEYGGTWFIALFIFLAKFNWNIRCT